MTGREVYIYIYMVNYKVHKFYFIHLENNNNNNNQKFEMLGNIFFPILKLAFFIKAKLCN
jgi:hypothetical protein